MAKFTNDDVLDKLLKEVAGNGDQMFVCSQQPASYAEASSTYALASTTLTKGAGNGDYSVGDGVSGGRKLTIAEQVAISVNTSGTATHIAICDSVNSKILLITTCNSQALTAGNTVTIPSFSQTVSDPQ